MNIQGAIKALIEGQDLDKAQMTTVMRQIMTGEATPAQIGGFLIALNMKGETVDEIAAAAAVMRELATQVTVDLDHLVDTCGTGGDAKHTFNVSTATAFVTAAAGGRVAKHGNRSVSSSSGSADLLEAAGANLELDPVQVGECIRDVGVGFLFAPRHHSAMRHAVGPRREMAVRTIFNLLGPLTNPAGAPNQLLGVFAPRWVRPLAEVLRELGSERVLVVHAEDGLDEISIGAPTRVSELNQGEVRDYVIEPEQFNMSRAPLEAIKVDSAGESLAIIRDAFQGKPGPGADIIALNAGAAIYAAGRSDSLAEGIDRARACLADKEAEAKLEEFVAYTRRFAKAENA